VSALRVSVPGRLIFVDLGPGAASSMGARMRRQPVAFFLGDAAFMADPKFRALMRRLPEPEEDDHDPRSDPRCNAGDGDPERGRRLAEGEVTWLVDCGIASCPFRGVQHIGHGMSVSREQVAEDDVLDLPPTIAEAYEQGMLAERARHAALVAAAQALFAAGCFTTNEAGDAAADALRAALSEEAG
jgi:hypothetical protein